METKSVDITKNVNLNEPKTTTGSTLGPTPKTTTPVRSTPDPKEDTKLEERKEATPKKPKTRKARKAEELVDASLKSMSDKEKDILINYFKEELTKAGNQIEEFKHNAESAYEKVRMTENQMHSMETFINERLQYIDEAAKAFYKSICLATKGDVK